eukprot:TRINITY_DN3726_c0_g2_i11.p1 TRINITY_DN3726_c0_g2~~TRINITY_DN3726_c0_g2_i11.p1  ORF type:complete len:270 (-),score=24.12 TRINITY_DN3726_c0_g2_i11:325-1134(-)
MDSTSKVDAYVSLAKSVRGVALIDLIQKALDDPGLYYFSELLDLPQVKELKTGENVQRMRILEMFAYGTWRDYKALEANLPKLTSAQIIKLKQLTVAGLALENKILEYKVLSFELDINSGMRELEDFLIKDCIYKGIIKGKLDQRNACVHITHTVGRDVKREQLPQISAQLKEWLQTSDQVISGIEQCLQQLQKEKDNIQGQRQALEQQIEVVRQQVQQDKDTDENSLDQYMDIRPESMEPSSSRNKRSPMGVVGRFGAGMIRGFLDQH